MKELTVATQNQVTYYYKLDDAPAAALRAVYDAQASGINVSKDGVLHHAIAWFIETYDPSK